MSDEREFPFNPDAVEFGRAMGRMEAERAAVEVLARIVDAAGGEVIVTDRAMVEDAPLMRSDDPVNGTTRYWIKRRSAVGSAVEGPKSGGDERIRTAE